MTLDIIRTANTFTKICIFKWIMFSVPKKLQLKWYKYYFCKETSCRKRKRKKSKRDLYLALHFWTWLILLISLQLETALVFHHLINSKARGVANLNNIKKEKEKNQNATYNSLLFAWNKIKYEHAIHMHPTHLIISLIQSKLRSHGYNIFELLLFIYIFFWNTCHAKYRPRFLE